MVSPSWSSSLICFNNEPDVSKIFFFITAGRPAEYVRVISLLVGLRCAATFFLKKSDLTPSILVTSATAKKLIVLVAPRLKLS